jgi:hypothetical protein
MAGFKKAVLRVGTYYSPDGEVPVTPERLQHWRNEFHRMKSARQVVPIDWDHAEQSNRDGLTPLSLGDFRKRRSARNTVGHLVDFDVTEDGAVLTLDVPDEDAAGKADKNLIFVSPVISPAWRDGALNEYADCITHVDFVNHPVDYSQGPFERVPEMNQQPAIACALRMGLGTQFYVPKQQGTKQMVTFLPKIVRMAEDNREPDGWATNSDGKRHPVFDSKGRSKKSRGKRKAGKKAVSRLSLFVRMAEDAEPVIADVIPEPEDAYDVIDEVLDLLEEFDIRLPDDTTDENLVDRLRTALIAKGGDNQMTDTMDDLDDMPDLPPIESTDEPPIAETPVAMSIAATNHIRQQYRTSLQQRLQRLARTGRCTESERDDHLKDIGAIKLSLAANGNPVRCELERWIKSREDVPAGTFWSETRRLSLQQRVMNVAQPKTEDPDKLAALQKMIFRNK